MGGGDDVWARGRADALPVSSTASRASGMRCALAASAAALKILSTCWARERRRRERDGSAESGGAPSQTGTRPPDRTHPARACSWLKVAYSAWAALARAVSWARAASSASGGGSRCSGGAVLRTAWGVAARARRRGRAATGRARERRQQPQQARGTRKGARHGAFAARALLHFDCAPHVTWPWSSPPPSVSATRGSPLSLESGGGGGGGAATARAAALLARPRASGREAHGANGREPSIGFGRGADVRRMCSAHDDVVWPGRVAPSERESETD